MCFRDLFLNDVCVLCCFYHFKYNISSHSSVPEWTFHLCTHAAVAHINNTRQSLKRVETASIYLFFHWFFFMTSPFSFVLKSLASHTWWWTAYRMDSSIVRGVLSVPVTPGRGCKITTWYCKCRLSLMTYMCWRKLLLTFGRFFTTIVNGTEVIALKNWQNNTQNWIFGPIDLHLTCSANNLQKERHDL